MAVNGGPVPPTVPDPPPPPPATLHVPLIDRVAALEDRLTQLSAAHNHFVDDVSMELGL